MDLRPYILDKKQLDEGIRLIRRGDLNYQPFILADDVEVGEGQNQHDDYRNVTAITDFNVYAPRFNVGKRRPPSDAAYFRRCNQEYRDIYNYVADQICAHSAHPISNYTIGEIGCNAGLNLFNLAKRGAKACYGYDWSDYTGLFQWMNGLLGTNVQFTRGVYDNLYHQFKGDAEVAEVDIMISTVFTNHQCDPLQFLAFMCDRARKGVFLWALIHSGIKDACVLYTTEMAGDILGNDRPFPLSFYNGVVVSEPLLRVSLQYLGFDELQPIEKFVPSQAWDRFQEGFRMYYARRTRDVKSAYWATRRQWQTMPPRSGQTKSNKVMNLYRSIRSKCQ